MHVPPKVGQTGHELVKIVPNRVFNTLFLPFDHTYIFNFFVFKLIKVVIPETETEKLMGATGSDANKER